MNKHFCTIGPEKGQSEPVGSWLLSYKSLEPLRGEVSESVPCSGPIVQNAKRYSVIKTPAHLDPAPVKGYHLSGKVEGSLGKKVKKVGGFFYGSHSAVGDALF